MICHNKWSKPFSNCFIMGPTGPTGPAGNGISIQGSYDTYEMLKREHPTGNPTESYIVDGDLYTWSDKEKDWINVGKIKGPKGDPGPQGEIGPQGPPGPNSIRAAYIITYNEDIDPNGIKISVQEAFPYTRKELDITNLITLDTAEKTIKFNVAGYYKVNIIISGYIIPERNNIDKTTEFIAFGLREKGTDNTYIGASEWRENDIAKQITAEGIIAVIDPSKAYEIANLSKKEIYLHSPSIKYISSKSYFTNSIITINIEYLGKP